jgi:glycosyltransferase involved in cell wall biosynthesis
VPTQPSVSVVTPVRNGGPYLEECINSVLAQTYENWNYVILDNCSTDCSQAIAERYATMDSRIHVYSNDTLLPQKSNFNRALSLASPTSAYYKMVLADDWLFPECLERMVGLAEANRTVGVVSSYQLAGTEVVAQGLPFPSTVVSGREICRMQLRGGPFVFGSPSSILVRGDVVRQRKPFFSESALHADTDACYAVLREWDFGFVHQVLTFKRTDNDGISFALKDLSPYELDKFISLLTYGPHYLHESEFEHCLNQYRQSYFRLLGFRLLYPGGWATFRYHKTALRSIGYDISLATLAPSIACEVARKVLNPIETSVEAIKACRWLLRSVTTRRGLSQPRS